MRQTPGIYMEEIQTALPAIAQKDMSVPIFIGYTKKAGRRGRSLLRTPVKISSLNQYHSWFGHYFNPSFYLEKAAPGDPEKFTLNNREWSLRFAPHNEFYLYQSVQLFFLNGGRECYIMSIGIYGEQPFMQVMPEHFTGQKTNTGIFKQLEKETEATLIVLPDVAASRALAYPIYQEILDYCAKSKRYFAIIDVCQERDLAANLQDFREGIGTNALQYAAAYYPWLQSNLVEPADVNYSNLHPSISLLETLGKATPGLANILQQIHAGNSKTKAKNIHLALLAASPEYVTLMNAVQAKRNVVPPCGAVAGIYSRTDHTKAVWKAPAIEVLNAVTAPTIRISTPQLETLFTDVDKGKYINAIRIFPNKGTLLWGARTLDGSSSEWRYIPVRRTIMMLELSVGEAMNKIVFDENTPATWAQLKIVTENFLHLLWRQGAFAGIKPQEAYHVKIGLGSTMTAADVAEGRLKMHVLVALLKPAEFSVISFQQIQLKAL